MFASSRIPLSNSIEERSDPKKTDCTLQRIKDKE